MPTLLPSGPNGDTVAASSGHGNTPRRQPTATAAHRQVQPTPCTQPSTSCRCFDIPPIHTTRRAVNTIDSRAEYMRTARKYDTRRRLLGGDRFFGWLWLGIALVAGLRARAARENVRDHQQQHPVHRMKSPECRDAVTRGGEAE